MSKYLWLLKFPFSFKFSTDYIFNQFPLIFREFHKNISDSLFVLLVVSYYSLHCPWILFSNVFPSVHSGCVGKNMAASKGRLVGSRGLHSTRCLLRTTNMSTAKSTISKGIGAKECRRTFFTSIFRQGKALPVISRGRRTYLLAGWLSLASSYRPWCYLWFPCSSGL